MSCEFNYNVISYGSDIKNITMSEIVNQYNTYAIDKQGYRSQNREYRKVELTVVVLIGSKADIDFNKIANSSNAGLNDSISYIRFTTIGSESFQFNVLAMQKPSHSQLLDTAGAEELNLATYKISCLLEDRQVESF